MRKKANGTIPPPRYGRRLGPVGLRLVGLEVGASAVFERGKDTALRTLASTTGKRLGRRYVVRVEDERTIAVWREA